MDEVKADASDGERDIVINRIPVFERKGMVILDYDASGLQKIFSAS